LQQNGHKRIAILLSSPVSDEQRENIKKGIAPRHDILTLAAQLNATLILPDGQGWGKAGKLSRIRQMAAMALRAFKRRNEYDVIITDLDSIGAVLAVLFKITRTRRGHVVICHGKLARGMPGRIARLLRVHKQVDTFVCYGPAVAKRFIDDVKIPASKVRLVKHPADHHFWKSANVAPERLISSAGMTFRDYVTLAEAVRGLDVKVQLAAFSPWVNPKLKPPDVELPGNVTFTRLPPAKLRELYDRSLFIVVPLKQTYSQAGSLVIYEAMSMGKAVVATETHGEKALSLVREGETGMFFQPGDVKRLREIIQDLLNDPEKARRMGRAARAEVESGLNLDHYLQEMVSIVRGIAEGGAVRPEHVPAKAAD
jgi:glycosyltransferase involved in cell wall biosynthesis